MKASEELTEDKIFRLGFEASGNFHGDRCYKKNRLFIWLYKEQGFYYRNKKISSLDDLKKVYFEVTKQELI